MTHTSQKEQAEIIKYFERYALTVSSDLRRYKGRLGTEWEGIDKCDLSVILDFCSDGFMARLLPAKLSNTVKTRQGGQLKKALVTRFKATVPFGKQVRLFFSVKEHPGESSFDIYIKSKSSRPEMRFDTESRKLFHIVSPRLLFGTALRQQADTKSLADLLRDPNVGHTPLPWLHLVFTRSKGPDILDKLPDDPVIFAHGLADHILELAGLINDPSARYRNAASELKEAIKTLSQKNEKAIHAVIKKYPFILVAEYDYWDFLSEPRFKVRESMDAGDKEKEIAPDFVYKLYDESCLVVEIESAKKRILKKSQETGYQLPSAEAVAALFQIQNYRNIMDGYGYKDVRKKLKIPDRWRLDYLLVAGSTLAKNFDQRSWNNLRDFYQKSSISIKNWDHYLDQLERRAEAARFSINEGGNHAEK